MEEKRQESERVRKAYAKRGTRSQAFFNFRCDLDNLEWLNKQPNKGRAVNEAIRAAREKEQGT